MSEDNPSARGWSCSGFRDFLTHPWAAILVSMAALAVATCSVCATQRHNRLSVRPHLTIKFVDQGKQGGWVLRSTGAGPAVPRYFEVTVAGQAVKEWAELRKPLGISQGFCGSSETFDYGEIIPPGDRRRLYWAWEQDRLREMAQMVPEVEMLLCYCSVYETEAPDEECWTATFPPSVQQPGACPSNPKFQTSKFPAAMIGDTSRCEQLGLPREMMGWP